MYTNYFYLEACLTRWKTCLLQCTIKVSFTILLLLNLTKLE